MAVARSSGGAVGEVVGGAAGGPVAANGVGHEGRVMHADTGSVKTSITAPEPAIKALTCDDAGS